MSKLSVKMVVVASGPRSVHTEPRPSQNSAALRLKATWLPAMAASNLIYQTDEYFCSSS